MKPKYNKLMIVFLLAVLIVAGFGACKPTEEECDSNWRSLKWSINEQLGDLAAYQNDAMTISAIMMMDYPSDSMGKTVQRCIKAGWDGWME